MPISIRFVVAFTFLVLVGCAAPVVKSTVIKEPEARAGSVNFGMAGRVSVKQGGRGFSGGVRWRHADADDEILLLSPLGQTVAQIQRSPDGALLTNPEQKTYRAADVESLTEQVLGWRLPLTGLQYWVLGMSSPATVSSQDMDSDGRVVAIRQDGWEIAYTDYFLPEPAQPPQAIRPRVLVLYRSDAQIEIRLVIDSWDAE